VACAVWYITSVICCPNLKPAYKQWCDQDTYTKTKTPNENDIIYRGVRNPMKISDIGFLKTEPNRPQNSKTENSFSAVQFSKNGLWRFGDGFSHCFIQNSSCSMIGSTVTVFFFMPYLCTFSSESLQLTISWTNLARKNVISSVIHIKQHTEQKTEPKTETAVNLVKRNRKPQSFWKTEPKSFYANHTPLIIYMIGK